MTSSLPMPKAKAPLVAKALFVALLFTGLGGETMLFAQREIQPAEGPLVDLRVALREIGMEGRALYVTAHPDDEDNRLFAHLRIGRGISCTLLTLTRGEGGQNAIGSELFSALGVLRMQELAAAHRYDRCAQLFGQSYEFGYSFSVEETFIRWNEDLVLKDIVQAIRSVRPQVIFTMPRVADVGGQHHQASALATAKAFDIAASDRWPELGPPFAADRLYEQVWGPAPPEATLFLPPIDDFEPLIGATWRDYGFIARSAHKCQATGQILDQDGSLRFRSFALVKWRGPKPKSGPDAFAGLPIVRDAVDGTLQPSDRARPFQAVFGPFEGSAPDEIRERLEAALQSAPEPFIPKIDAALAQATPVMLEARIGDPVLIPGEERSLRLLLRNDSTEALSDVRVWTSREEFFGRRILFEGALKVGERQELSLPFRVPLDAPSTAVRLEVPEGPLDRHKGADLHLPQSAVQFGLEARVRGRRLLLKRAPMVALEVDESLPRAIASDAVVLPRVTATFPREVIVLPESALEQKSRVEVPLKLNWRGSAESDARALRVALRASVSGSDGAFWTGTQILNERGPQDLIFRLPLPDVLGRDGTGARLELKLEAHAAMGEEALLPLTTVDRIAYAHIRPAWHERLARSKVVVFGGRLPERRRLASLSGQSDPVAAMLRESGVALVALTERDLAEADWKDFDAILVGVRAYHQRPDLKRAHSRLMDWVRAGGHLIVQYQRGDEFNSGLSGRGGSPYTPEPARIDGKRISDENAPPRLLVPDHPFFTHPHRLGPKDWRGWRQERSTYHLETKGPSYEALLAFEDPFPLNAGEKTGALVTAKVGAGRWTYVGLSLFRQIPAGVPGAWRLLTNLLEAEEAP